MTMKHGRTDAFIIAVELVFQYTHSTTKRVPLKSEQRFNERRTIAYKKLCPMSNALYIKEF